MTTYETPRITTYGTLAELTGFDAASGGVLIGDRGLSLSAVPGTGPGGGTDLPPSQNTAPPPPPPPAAAPGGELTTSAASVTGPVSTFGASELQSAVPTEGGTTPGVPLTSTTPSGPDAPGDGRSEVIPEATLAPGDLPFTGGAVGLVAAVGGVLTATGAALRRAVKRH